MLRRTLDFYHNVAAKEAITVSGSLPDPWMVLSTVSTLESSFPKESGTASYLSAGAYPEGGRVIVDCDIYKLRLVTGANGMQLYRIDLGVLPCTRPINVREVPFFPTKVAPGLSNGTVSAGKAERPQWRKEPL